MALPALLIALYAAWPCATLFRLRQEISRHDVLALQRDIDWNSVRSGLKQEVLNGLEPHPAATRVAAVTGDDLPPFGSSFVAGLAGNVVDQQVTPQRLADAFQTLSPGRGDAWQPQIQSAGFDGLTHFDVTLSSMPGSPAAEPVRLNLELVRTGWRLGWKVSRVWLPPSLLPQSETHAS